MAGMTALSRSFLSAPILIRLLAIGLAFALNLAFVAMVLNPRVSPEYRDYYITKASRVWTNDPYPVLQTGVLYRKGSVAYPTVIGTGWSAPTASGTWSESPSAYLLLRLPAAPQEGLKLVLSGYPFLWPERADQVAEVFVNGQPAGSLRFSSPAEQDYEIDLPVGPIREQNGYAAVELRFKDLKSPHDLKIQKDFRLLGFHMTGLRLEAR